ncbi:MAG: sigma-70 family RNA polymerase sigma factor, partial [Anaerolineae bacterium]|nr:sigma-70 family RNA polymerase sigma factor [Anaerolineae bacterium]
MASPANPHNDEPLLIRQAQRGDLDAFNALVLRFQDRVYGLTYRIMGDDSSAADMAQDTFITAYRRLDTYRGGSFRAWLLRIATNTCYDELRRHKRRPATSLEDLPGAEMDDGPALPDDAPTPEQAAQQHELNHAIQDCIESLGDAQRLILVLSDIEGLSYQEVATIAGTKVGTVKFRLSRARVSVRDCLQAVQELLP